MTSIADSSCSSTGFKSWDLTPYEQQRKCHELIKEGELSISPKSLQSELTCPICLDLLRNTRTTKECLHRFCSDCIETALRSGNKECPTCRKKLISKRCLRRDENIDALIAQLFPSRNSVDEFHDKVLGATTSSAKNGRKSKKDVIATKDSTDDEDKQASQDGEKKNGESSTSSSKPNGKRQRLSESPPPTPLEITLQLRPHPLEPSPQPSTRTILTSLNATMNHLTNFLNARRKVEAGQQVQESSDQEYTWHLNVQEAAAIPSTMTLEKLVEQCTANGPTTTSSKKPRELFFRSLVR